ncbi:MAG: hypothetical protein ACRDLB_10705 [Actinomycetota bacterium]
MSVDISTLVRSLTGQEAALYCRSCHDRVSPRDPFGMSEGICSVCRAAESESRF